MKEFLIRDEQAFKLRGKMKPCLGLDKLWCIEFTGECYNEKGEIVDKSTYQFFLEDDHINNMVKGLTA
jgi:hypothetical protein